MVSANTLKQNKTYNWKVTGNTQMNSIESITEFFTTRNIVPGTFHIVNPINNDMVNSASEISLTWTKSKDTDSLTYNLIATDGYSVYAYSTQDTMFVLPANTLAKGKDYLIQVGAFDGYVTTMSPPITVQTANDIQDGRDIIEMITRISVYPNPIKINAVNASTLYLEIHDITGRELQGIPFECAAVTNNLPINLDTYAKGIYVLVIKSLENKGTVIKTEKIIKE